MCIDKNNFSFIVHVSVNGTTGSGFLFTKNENLYLVTAKHVLLDKENKLIGNNIVIIAKDLSENIGTATTYEIQIDDLTNITFSSNLDIDAIALKIEENASTIIHNKVFRPIVTESDIISFENNLILERIFVGGCPTSLSIDINDYDMTRASFRSGIVSSIYEKDFLIDCPSYYGMSGGPVFLFDGNGELKIIGVISKFVPLLVQWFNNRERSIVNTDFENSGFTICVKLNDLILELN